jgi:KUP system potassium uptake protein
MTIRHTSGREIGQIYVPAVNTLLLVSSIALVVAFRTSSNLAAAYGVAVTATMIITTILLYRAMTDRWGWRPAVALSICAAFGAIDLAFLGANLAKVLHGGWVPLLVGALGYAIMSTWVRGRELLRARIAERIPPPGTAIFLSREPHGVPRPLSQYLDHIGPLHETVVLLTIATRDVPHVPADARVTVEERGSGIWRVVGAYGFMDEPSVPDVLAACEAHGLVVDPARATFFLGTETLYATRRPGMSLWRERLFALLSHNAQRATRSFDIPGHRTVELGLPIDL